MHLMHPNYCQITIIMCICACLKKVFIVDPATMHMFSVHSACVCVYEFMILCVCHFTELDGTCACMHVRCVCVCVFMCIFIPA